MPRNKKLYPGVGARCTILTRFIHPRVHPLSDQGADKNHRTEVELISAITEKVNKKQQQCFQFRFLDETEGLGYAVKTHFVVMSEGNRANFFNPDDIEASKNEEKEANFKEPKIKWRNSKAKKILQKAVVDGDVSEEATGVAGELEVIYGFHEDFKLYSFGKFAARLARVREDFTSNTNRAAADLLDFNNYISHHEVSKKSRKGYPQWQGSNAQHLLLTDILNNLHKSSKPIVLWRSRPEYYNQFPLTTFRSKLEQQIRTAKYLHTVKMKGVQYKAS